MSREQRRARRRKVGTHTSICVVCGKPIPRRQPAMYVTDQWNGTVYGAHINCGSDHKALMAGLKAAMTTPEFIRFRWRKFWAGKRRMWATFAARWSTSKKMVG